MSKILLTGATGYLGGETLYQLCQLPVQHEITVLVRNQSKADQITEVFPNVRSVIGDLDDVSVITEAARSADIVLHLAATGHAVSSKAIVEGLTTPKRTRPGYWIQMSGASMYSITDISNGTYGELGHRSYDDVKDIDEIRRIIQTNPDRIVDQLALSQDPTQVKVALIPGPLIYGVGRGPGNTNSIQATTIARHTLKLGEGFRIGAGRSAWSTVGVRDVGTLLVKLVEAAAAGTGGLWNENGIYHPENGKMEFGELGERIAHESHAQGFIKSANVTKTIRPEDADHVTPGAAILFATNAIITGSRAREALGWQPVDPELSETISEVVRIEAKRLGMLDG